jgi:hypothetical protein
MTISVVIERGCRLVILLTCGCEAACGIAGLAVLLICTAVAGEEANVEFISIVLARACVVASVD